MRIAHSDVYTNERLHRFGLINNPKCVSCDEPSENLNHRLIDCWSARETWQLLERAISQMGLDPLENITLEGIMGINYDPHDFKLALTLRAELISRLMSRGDKTYHPRALVRTCLKTILIVEKLTVVQKSAINEALSSI